jgi:hypothetical protein
MLKNAANGGRMKWPFTCVATTGTEILSFNMNDLLRAAHNIDRAVNEEMDRIMAAVAVAPPVAAAMAKSAKLSAELRACAERSHVIWLGRYSSSISSSSFRPMLQNFIKLHSTAWPFETAKLLGTHPAFRSCRVLSRGQPLDGVFVLLQVSKFCSWATAVNPRVTTACVRLQGSLSVHVAQKVRASATASRNRAACFGGDSSLAGADINGAAGAAPGCKRSRPGQFLQWRAVAALSCCGFTCCSGFARRAEQEPRIV